MLMLETLRKFPNFSINHVHDVAVFIILVQWQNKKHFHRCMRHPILPSCILNDPKRQIKIRSFTTVQREVKLNSSFSDLKSKENTHSLQRTRCMVPSSTSRLSLVSLYEAAEMESIGPRFLVSCLLRCSGFSAAVRGRRERLGGWKRECVRGEGRGGEEEAGREGGRE